jgi:hypothetical protein
MEAGHKPGRAISDPASGAGRGRTQVALSAGVIGLVSAVNLFSLLRTPPPFIDEVWFANRAWALVTTGRNFGTMDSGVFDHFPGYWTYFPWLPSAFQGIGLRLFGLDLLGLRVVSLAFGLVLLAAVYATVRRLAGPAAALAAVFLVGLSRGFVYSAHLGRPDIMTAALGFGAVAAWTTVWPGPKFPVGSMVAGLLAALSVEFHPFGGLYVAVLGLALPVELARRRAGLRALWAFGIGAGLGFGVYLGLHVLPYPETYTAINNLVALSSGAVRTPPIFTPDYRMWAQSVADMATQFGSLWNLRIPLVIWGIILLARSQNPAYRRLLTICVLLLAGYLGLIRNKNPWYAIMVSPAGDILAATSIAWLAGPGWAWLRYQARNTLRVPANPAAWESLRLLVLGGLLLVLTVPTLTRMASNPLPDYRLIVGQLQRLAGPGDVVMGPATYWLGIPDTRYISWEQLIYYRRFRSIGPGEAMTALGVKYFIVDTYIDKFITDDPRESVNAQQLTVSRSELGLFLARHGAVVARIETKTYGVTTVYRINSSDQEVSGR